ncbi:hypothetical protein [Streptomyces shenzhenensis]|uniref:hypothetical protein n=1 Tax=Streptomyces shenzhenensis TaxID=943815 RepID=UPI003680B432
MSSHAIAIAILAFLAASLAGGIWQVRRAARTESTRDRIVREAHERAEAAREADALELLYSLPAYDRVWAAGRDRLWDAIHDDQQKEGDQ